MLRSWLLPACMIAAGLAHAALQEKLFHVRFGLSDVPLVVTSFEFASCSGFSLLYLLLTRENPWRVPHGPLTIIALMVLISLVSGNIALKWVSYPVKVVVKSCKLLPTMAMGSLLLRKRYSLGEQMSALLLCIGLVGFTLADGPGGGGGGDASSPLGMGLLLVAVTADAVQVQISERMMRTYPFLTPMHVMLHSNGMALLAILVGIVATGEHARAPPLPVGLLCLYGSTSWIGVCCFIELTRSWGGAAAVAVTSSRKLLTVALSFVLFPKPFQPLQGLAGCAVIAGVALHKRGAKAASRTAEPDIQNESAKRE